MALGYGWTNVASWSYSNGTATVTFWVDAKLNRQDTTGNYSIVDTRLNSTVVNNIAGSGYNYQLTGSGGSSGSGTWYFGNETILTGQYRVNHNANGTASTNIHAWVSNTYWKFGQSIDATVSLPTINRTAVINTFTGNDIEGDFKATYTTRASGFSYKLRISIPNVTALETFNYSSGTTFRLSETTKNTIYNYAKNNNLEKVPLGAVIETWSSSKVGESSELINQCDVGSTAKICINGVETKAIPHVAQNGVYKRARLYGVKNGNWERSK